MKINKAIEDDVFIHVPCMEGTVEFNLITKDLSLRTKDKIEWNINGNIIHSFYYICKKEKIESVDCLTEYFIINTKNNSKYEFTLFNPLESYSNIVFITLNGLHWISDGFFDYENQKKDEKKKKHLKQFKTVSTENRNWDEYNLFEKLLTIIAGLIVIYAVYWFITNIFLSGGVAYPTDCVPCIGPESGGCC